MAVRSDWSHRQHRAGSPDGTAVRVPDGGSKAGPAGNRYRHLARLSARRPPRPARLPEGFSAPRHSKARAGSRPPGGAETAGPPLGVTGLRRPVTPTGQEFWTSEASRGPCLPQRHVWPAYGLRVPCRSLVFRLCSARIPLVFRLYSCLLESEKRPWVRALARKPNRSKIGA